MHTRPGRPAHRLIRDALEAEDLALDWLRWVGFGRARRLDVTSAAGIRAEGLYAFASFDPLPLERSMLEDSLGPWRGETVQLASFAFAGWSAEAIDWADRHGVALIRFTFAGDLDPSNARARELEGRTRP